MSRGVYCYLNTNIKHSINTSSSEEEIQVCILDKLCQFFFSETAKHKSNRINIGAAAKNIRKCSFLSKNKLSEYLELLSLGCLNRSSDSWFIQWRNAELGTGNWNVGRDQSTASSPNVNAVSDVYYLSRPTNFRVSASLPTSQGLTTHKI